MEFLRRNYIHISIILTLTLLISLYGCFKKESNLDEGLEEISQDIDKALKELKAYRFYSNSKGTYYIMYSPYS